VLDRKTAMTLLGRRPTPRLESLAASLPDTRWLVDGSRFIVESPHPADACRDALADQFRVVPDIVEWLKYLTASRPHRQSMAAEMYPADGLYGWSTYDVTARVGPWPHPFSPWAIATFDALPEGTRLEGTVQLPRWSIYAAIAISTVWMLYFWRDTASAHGINAFISEALEALVGFAVLAVILVFVFRHARHRFLANQRLLLERITEIVAATTVVTDTGEP
jgi:hypothetical protein